MKLISIEPTPSPNTMKLNVDETLAKGVYRTFTQAQEGHPAYVNALLAIPGVKALYRAADFIALDRKPQGDWAAILRQATELLGASEGLAAQVVDGLTEEAWGEVRVLVQMFRGIPMQVRAVAGGIQVRAALPERFTQAAMTAGAASPTLLQERRLEEYGVRYGELEEIAPQVAEEIDASYDNSQLESLVQAAIQKGQETEAGHQVNTAAPEENPAASPAVQSRARLSVDEIAARLQDDDWKVRYGALQQLKPALEHLPLLSAALADSNVSVRRLATVYTGDVREPEALPLLFRALQDPSAAVRRTAGDTLSDIGNPAAAGPMCEALRDSNKLVRWRAARFLYEAGDESALPALQEAIRDPEFEVSLQARMAVERIESGEAAAGAVWQQMTRLREGE
ncbi:conserved virulence factor C family protein [Paenibacillus sp. y28]|uniref:conserved virulence factor C family protein n=1 Tax=Paenibacillus sp. y28 TaxID=3129110 RepID=UPI003017EA51